MSAQPFDRPGDEHSGEFGSASVEFGSVGSMVRRPVPDSLEGCRAAIDEADTVLAILLEYRTTLAEQVQRLKPVGGHAGRDHRREAEIVERMSHRAPKLGAQRLHRIMMTVIEAGLDVAEERGA